MIKKTVLVLCLSALPFAVFADDSGLADLIYGTAPAETNNSASNANSNEYMARQYKNDAAKLNKTSRVNTTASKSVQNAEKEKIKLERNLRVAYLKLSEAYQNNNAHLISKYEMLTWKMKELIKISEEKVSLAYQISEFEKGLRDYPNSTRYEGACSESCVRCK